MATQPHVPSAVRRMDEEARQALGIGADGSALPAAPGEAPDGTPRPEAAETVALPPEGLPGEPETGAPIEVDAQGLDAQRFDPTTGTETPTERAPQDPTGQDAEAWRQRYQVLQGKYNAETRELRERLQTAVMALEVLQRAAPTGQRAEPGAAEVSEEELTDERLKKLAKNPSVIDDYGGDLVREVIGIVRKVEGQRRTAAAGDEEVVQELRTEVKRSRLERLELALDRELPGWQRQDNDVRFVAWLRTSAEPLSGLSYEALLARAMKDGDAKRVAGIYRAWPGAGRAAAAPGNGQAVRVPVERQTAVRPSGAPRTAPGGQEPAKKVWTQDEIMAAATQIATGILGPTRTKAVRAELDAALAERRVRSD